MGGCLGDDGMLAGDNGEELGDTLVLIDSQAETGPTEAAAASGVAQSELDGEPMDDEETDAASVQMQE